MAEDQDEQEDEVTGHDKRLIKAAVDTLMKHFDFVQILAGSQTGGITSLISYGDGNVITRIGQAHIWLNAMTRANSPSEEDDFE